MQKKPLIGLLPLWDAERESYWMLPGYMEGVMAAGGLPVMLPLCSDREGLRQLTAQLDGFLFTGGQDVAPALYGEVALPACGPTCPARDAMETLLLQLALEADKPVLGICRGLQFINVVLGGSLYQDLPTQRPSELQHSQTPPYSQPAHRVEILQDAPLHGLLKRDELAVNSCHHQAVKALSPRLLPMARSTDGLVEAAWMPGQRFVWAVQWHPECAFARDEASLAIFRCFLAAAA